MTASFTLGKPTIYSTTSREKWREMKKNAIKDWYFEKTGNGVKPVVGKCDPNNPDHIPIRKVVGENQ
jgi:hypothetical protein